MKLIFFISKNWQIKNFNLLIQKLKKNNKFSYGFLCVDNYTGGTAYKDIKNSNKFKIPKKKRGFFFNFLGRFKITKEISNFIENIDSHNNRTILILDSIIGDGYLFARDLKLYANYEIFLLQHSIMDFEKSFYLPEIGWKKNKIKKKIINKWFWYSLVLITFYQLISKKIFNFRNYRFLKYIDWNKFSQINLLPFYDKLFVFTQHDKLLLCKRGCRKNNILVSGRLFYLFDDKKNNTHKTSRMPQKIILFTSGDIYNDNGHKFINELLKFVKKNKFKILFKIKKREENFFKTYFSKYKFNFKAYKKSELSNSIILVPGDSHLNLELSSLKIKYFAYSTYLFRQSLIKNALVKNRSPIIYDVVKSDILDNFLINKILKNGYKGSFLKKDIVNKLIGNSDNKVILNINNEINEKI